MVAPLALAIDATASALPVADLVAGCVPRNEEAPAGRSLS
jgi:hypothetical protein